MSRSSLVFWDEHAIGYDFGLGPLSGRRFSWREPSRGRGRHSANR